MSGPRFLRTVEDFECGNCHLEVAGDGYTNHCPACLFSRHVDLSPGDRLASCGGLMRPLSALVAREGYVLVHQCERCGHSQRNRSAPADDIEELLRYAARPLTGPPSPRSRKAGREGSRPGGPARAARIPRR